MLSFREGGLLINIIIGHEVLRNMNQQKRTSKKSHNSRYKMIKMILNSYARMSGQHISASKSMICFSKVTPYILQDAISGKLNIIPSPNLGCYLGVHFHHSASKKIPLQPLIDQFQQSLLSWKEKFLSLARKDVLIRSIAQALPVYQMMSFKLPFTIIKQMEAIVAKFWLGEGTKEELEYPLV
ncbi:hypothetical protein Scep_004071 [Stephania cephalantha]|uniref:Uncharacterized protein n=1 Tax=Stephania cephalantha TaxID=152367 RepID=A0AAP0KRR0_9MAGN